MTLEIFETLWQQGYRNMGVVLQACSASQRAGPRARMNALGARVRLVKGAYTRTEGRSPISDKADVDAAYLRMMQLLLDRRHLSGHRHARRSR